MTDHVTGTVPELDWRLLNGSVVPLWAAMILAPRSRATRWLMDRSGWWFAGLSAAYVVEIARNLATADRPDGFGPDSVRSGLATPLGFLTGWAHFLAFDLFVGRWIWERSVAEDRSARLALLLTFLAGPAGLGVFAVQRGSLRPELVERA